MSDFPDYFRFIVNYFLLKYNADISHSKCQSSKFVFVSYKQEPDRSIMFDLCCV